MTDHKPLKRSPSTPAREKPPWDPTCARPGYYKKEAAPLQAVRVLASPSSTLKSPPCYGFSREERPRPGAKQAWRMDMKMEASSPFSPGPIYYPNINSAKATPPKFSVTSRVKPLAGPSGPGAPGTGQLHQGGAQSTTASTTGAGHFLSGKSIKNRKMGAGGASGQGPAGASAGTSLAGKRRSSVNNHRQQQQQFFGNQQPGQFVNFE